MNIVFKIADDENALTLALLRRQPVKNSYDLIVAKLTKKERESLLLSND